MSPTLTTRRLAVDDMGPDITSEEGRTADAGLPAGRRGERLDGLSCLLAVRLAPALPFGVAELGRQGSLLFAEARAVALGASVVPTEAITERRRTGPRRADHCRAPVRCPTVGEAMVELRPSADGLEVLTAVAGDAFNTASVLTMDTSIDVVHGQDLGHASWCRHVKRAMAARRVTRLRRMLPDEGNGLYVVSVEDGGERTFRYHRAGSAAGATYTREGKLV